MIELVRDLRAINVLAKFENDPWKIMDVRVLTGLVCPAARPPARPPPARPLGIRQYPGALKGCGVKNCCNFIWTSDKERIAPRIPHWGKEFKKGNIDFLCAKLQNTKKFAKIVFGDYEKTRNLYWWTCLDLTIHQIWWLELEKWVQECEKRSAH